MAKELNEVKQKYDDIIKTAQENSINSPFLKSIKDNVSKLIKMENKSDFEKAELINKVLKDNKLKNLVEAEIKLKETMKRFMDRYGEGKISIKVHRLI